MYKIRWMPVLLVVGALVFARVGTAWAVPGLPSSFYGEIHFSNDPPQATDVVLAYVPGVSSPVGAATLKTYQGNLVYSINLLTDDNDHPGKDGGYEGDVISFTLGSRLVMTATFRGGTNVQRNIHPPDPVVTDTGPADEGTAVTLDVHTSQDWGGDISTYAFDCDNDGTYEIGPQAGATAQCTFLDSITAHAVSVRLVDAQGGVGTDSTMVTVKNVPPRVTFATSNDTTVSEGTTVHSYNYTLSDPGQDVIASVATGCGDHGAKVAGSDSYTDAVGSFQCTFPDGPANSTVTAQAIDDEGGVGGAATQAVVVSHLPPTADSLVATGSIDEGSSSALSLVHPADPSPVDITTLHYTFACDGQDSSLAASYALAGLTNSANCTFSHPGSFTVKGRVYDKDGDDNTYQATVAVNNVPPTHVDGGGPYYGLVGQPVLLHSTAACAPGDTCTYAWDLDDDGSYETLGQDVSFTQYTVNVYTVGLRVADDDGAYATDANGKIKVHLTSQQTTVKRYTIFLPIVIR